ncbi:MAG: thioredoxin family protein [Planctomycetota bacterium]
MSKARPPLLVSIVWILCCPLVLAGEQGAQSVEVSWETDYLHAMDAANQQRKMLLVFFHNPDDPQSQRLQRETLNNPEVQQKLREELVCLRLPQDAKVTLEGKEVVLLQHTTLVEMLGRPGMAIVDFVHADPKLHGYIVSVFPLTGSMFYGPKEMKVILDLPSGTLTQRTLIYAVRTHPEKPASALGCPDERLLMETESHSQYQASIRLQGHHGWGGRFPRIAAMLGGSPREVCAESWPGQNLVESAIECVRCWRMSSGHWSAVQSRNRAFGYDMKLGTNGIWYATGIFAAD